MNSTIFYTGSSPLALEMPFPNKTLVRALPTIKVNYINPEADTCLENFNEQKSYLVFLSKNSVQGLKNYISKVHLKLTFSEKMVWAVGPGTRNAVKNEFKIDSNIPENYSGTGLTQNFGRLKRRPVYIICGRETLPEFPAWLQREKWTYELIRVYKTTAFSNPQIKQHFKNTEREIVLFTSPKTVSGFLNSINQEGFESIFSKLASIGPTTSKMILKQGGKVFSEALIPDINKFMLSLIKQLAA